MVMITDGAKVHAKVCVDKRHKYLQNDDLSINTYMNFSPISKVFKTL